jgi:type I restriction enzyme S subunit
VSTDKLPDGWTRVKFGDVVRNVNENSRDLASDGLDRVVGLDHLDPSSLRLARWDNLADLPDGTTFTRKFKPGQVLFGKRRAYQRKAAVPDFAGVCSGDILVFEPADKRMVAEFLPYVVQSDGFFDHALGTSAGSLSPRTKWAELAKYEFALPPVDEQQRIVQVLAGFGHLEDSYRSALDAIGRRREAEIGALAGRTSDGLVPLGDLARVTSGESWSGSDERQVPEPGAVAVVGISSLKPTGDIEYEHPTYVLGLGSKPGLVTVDERSVIVIRTNGNPDRIGNAYLATADIAGCAVSAFTFCCTFKSREQAEFAFEYMSGRVFQRWATSLVAGSTGLKNLPINQLRLAMVPMLQAPGFAESYERLRSLRDLARSTSAAVERIAVLGRIAREALMQGAACVQ